MKMRENHTYKLRWKFALLFGLPILTGCGFHLRGWQTKTPNTTSQKIYLTGNLTDNFFIAQLKAGIVSLGDQLSSRLNSFDWALTILHTQITQRTLAITGAASMMRHRLTYQVTYQIQSQKMYHQTMPKKSLTNRLSQTYTTNATQHLSDIIKQQKIIQQLKKEAVQAIIAQLSTIS